MSEKAVYVAIRRDLRMRRGKEIAQGIHAVALLGYVEGAPLVVVQVGSLDELMSIADEARAAGVGAALARDAGLTEVAPGSVTAGAFGPVEKGRLATLAGATLY